MHLSKIIVLATTALSTFATPASADRLRPLFTGDDYPAEAVRKHHEGTIVFRATIGASGRVTKCDIIQSSGHAELDAVTCKLVRLRAKFKPKLDESGNPVEDIYESQANWFLPR